MAKGNKSVTITIREEDTGKVTETYFPNVPNFSINVNEVRTSRNIYEGTLLSSAPVMGYDVGVPVVKALPDDNQCYVYFKQIDEPGDYGTKDSFTYPDFTDTFTTADNRNSKVWANLLKMTPAGRDNYFEQRAIDTEKSVMFDSKMRKFGEIEETWNIRSSKNTPAYLARKNKVREIWPELGDLLDSL